MSLARRTRALTARLSRLEAERRPECHVIVCPVAGLSEAAMVAAYEDESGGKVGPSDFLVVIEPVARCQRFPAA